MLETSIKILKLIWFFLHNSMACNSSLSHSHSIIFTCQALALNLLKFFLFQSLWIVITVTSSAFPLHMPKIFEFRMQHYMNKHIGKILPSLPFPLSSSAPYLQDYVSIYNFNLTFFCSWIVSCWFSSHLVPSWRMEKIDTEFLQMLCYPSQMVYHRLSSHHVPLNL